MGIADQVAYVVIPLGAALHKEGSAIAAVIKIAMAFALVRRTIAGVDILLAVLIAVLVNIVEGGIPNGGYVGQLLIVSVYNLPPVVLPAIMVIGTLLDPIETLLNATGIRWPDYSLIAGIMLAGRTIHSRTSLFTSLSLLYLKPATEAPRILRSMHML